MLSTSAKHSQSTMAPPKKLPQERAQGKAALEAYFDVPYRKGRPKKATLASDVTEVAKKNHAVMGNKANAVSKKRGADNVAASSKTKEQKKAVMCNVPLFSLRHQGISQCVS
jgi:hypothetical protein